MDFPVCKGWGRGSGKMMPRSRGVSPGLTLRKGKTPFWGAGPRKRRGFSNKLHIFKNKLRFFEKFTRRAVDIAYRVCYTL